MTNEQKAWKNFNEAASGCFNGFEMVGIFHEKINKRDALIVDESDDCANCRGVHVGADGVTVYFFCEPDEVKKIVEFNRSVYCFKGGEVCAN